MSANFGKYPAEDRVKEMSKQEEILLKRKREIEKRLGMKEGMDSSASDGSGKSASVAPQNKYQRKQIDHPVADRSSVKSHTHSHSTSGHSSHPKMNKFSNDGSFLEQFRRLQGKQKVEVKKEEKESISDMSRLAPKSPSKVPLPMPRHPVFSDESQDDFSNPQDVKVKTEHETKDCGFYAASAETTEESKDINHPDWFKEALKKIQEKARQLNNTTPNAGSSEDSVSSQSEAQAKKRRSRWSESSVPEVAQPVTMPPASPSVVNLSVPDNLLTMVGEGEHIEAIRGVMVTRITRNSPAIYAYARKVFSSIDLTEAQWKQCEEQMKMNVVFQLLQAKQREADRLERQGKVKYEYDSDEDVDGGTWEHKRRAVEMAETQAKAVELTSNAEGKHHIGDFLPPDELARFMEKYRALKEGRDPDLSDYQDHKLTEENIGYKMLKSMGWTEGMGLGAEGKGITAPVNQTGRNENQGLGVERPDSLTDNDDEYDAYRKRMMLAYRFRPNPLNNPRRAYY